MPLVLPRLSSLFVRVGADAGGNLLVWRRQDGKLRLASPAKDPHLVHEFSQEMLEKAKRVAERKQSSIIPLNEQWLGPDFKRTIEVNVQPTQLDFQTFFSISSNGERLPHGEQYSLALGENGAMDHKVSRQGLNGRLSRRHRVWQPSATGYVDCLESRLVVKRSTVFKYLSLAEKSNDIDGFLAVATSLFSANPVLLAQGFFLSGELPQGEKKLARIVFKDGTPDIQEMPGVKVTMDELWPFKSLKLSSVAGVGVGQKPLPVFLLKSNSLIYELRQISTMASSPSSFFREFEKWLWKEEEEIFSNQSLRERREQLQYYIPFYQKQAS